MIVCLSPLTDGSPLGRTLFRPSLPILCRRRGGVNSAHSVLPSFLTFGGSGKSASRCQRGASCKGHVCPTTVFRAASLHAEEKQVAAAPAAATPARAP